MKAVMLSIQPHWCELIARGKKTLEIRKTQPKMKPPFKCYIYCTNEKKLKFWKNKRYSYADDHSHNLFDRCGNGKVIGEFVCDRIQPFDVPYPAFQGEMDRDILAQSCLTYYQLHRYAYHDCLYGWHISDLKIYDEPKELVEFWKAGSCPFANGSRCTYEYHCFRAGQIDRCGESLTRPPQSWCYVEEDNR